MLLPEGARSSDQDDRRVVTYEQLKDACRHRVIDVKIIGVDDPRSHMVEDHLVGTTIRLEEPELMFMPSDSIVHNRAYTNYETILPWRLIGMSVIKANVQHQLHCWLIESITLPS